MDENTKRQPAWFTMLLVALYGDLPTSEEAKELSNFATMNQIPLTNITRQKMANMFRIIIKEWSEKIPDTALWLVADKEWTPGPILQKLNQFCLTRQWLPQWNVGASKLILGDREYALPEETIAVVLKKKKRKARLAAMALVDHGSILNPDWLAIVS